MLPVQKSFNYNITAEFEYKRTAKEKIKTIKIFFNTDYICAIYENGDFKQ